ncbi:hypothetical protein PanWU01x14_252290 [Parasponia andersonii]|uniref:Retrovirus-related Pol polyprotein from transposon TNT 1-94-like beta-barrel domain-containing protein n=1 Tax=Parasponia andersonii TaxID=3476 RepID=A0A2P5BC40_PARAD|nr:hypothetical protein PanWU01x14_252290 [Parasponia andersonii]
MENKEDETLLMMVHDNKNKLEVDIWYLDIGYSNHIYGSKSFFSYLNEDYRTTVSFGDHSKINVMRKGDVQIKNNSDSIEIMSNVFYVPDLKSNLLSLGKLQEKGYGDTIKNGICEIYDSKRGLIA